jgi:hypothetical protein
MIKLTSFALTCLIVGGTANAGTIDSFVDQSRLYMSTSRAAAQVCLEAPKITSDVRIHNPELTREKPKDLEGYTSSTGVLQGLAHMAYGFEVEFTLEKIRTSEGFCIHISDMKINSGHKTPQVWLRPGLKKGSCSYDATVEHELQHVSNYHDHLRSFDQAVQRELPLMMRGSSYYKIETILEGVQAEERLKNEAVELVRKLHDRSYRKAEKIDISMDSPSEYRRLSNLCR